jgi:hypothetical protein
MYFLLDIDLGIRCVANESWKEILPLYYSEILHELQEKEVGLEFTADYNTVTLTTKYY